MDVKQLDILFHEYGYEAKELNTSYRVYVLNQGMYHGAEVVMLDDSNVDQVLAQYSKLLLLPTPNILGYLCSPKWINSGEK